MTSAQVFLTRELSTPPLGCYTPIDVHTHTHPNCAPLPHWGVCTVLVTELYVGIQWFFVVYSYTAYDFMH